MRGPIRPTSRLVTANEVIRKALRTAPETRQALSICSLLLLSRQLEKPRMGHSRGCKVTSCPLPLGALGGGIWEMSRLQRADWPLLSAGGLQCLARSGVALKAAQCGECVVGCARPTGRGTAGVPRVLPLTPPARPRAGWARPEQPCLCLPVGQSRGPGRVCLNELLEWPVCDERACGERCWQDLQRASGGASRALGGQLHGRRKAALAGRPWGRRKWPAGC